MTVEDRFWPKVEKAGPDECWEWTGAQSTRGYGRFWLVNRQRPAHQVSWELTHGKPFPEGMLACHHCDNPPCVNPAHIFVGSMSDNILDAVEKGRVVPNNRRNQTHCKHGHEFTPDNVYIRPSTGHRECRACQKRRTEAFYARAALEGAE